MKNIKTTVIIALIGAAGIIIAALIGKCDFSKNSEKKEVLPQTSFENNAEENNGGQIIGQVGTQNNYYASDTSLKRKAEDLQLENQNLKNKLHENKLNRTVHIPSKSIKEEKSNDAPINAPNALIVTKDQKGDNEITFTEPLPPSFLSANLQKSEGQFFNNHQRDTTEFKFKIQIEFEYFSSVNKNELAFAFESKSRYHINAYRLVNKATMSYTGAETDDKGNAFVCFIQNPLNGKYRVEVLTDEDIQEPLAYLLIRVDQDKIYRVSK